MAIREGLAVITRTETVQAAVIQEQALAQEAETVLEQEVVAVELAT